jgi:hypothetical protein
VRRLVSDPPRDARWDALASMSREEQRVFAEREWFGRICTEHLRPRVEAASDVDLIIREPCEYASAIVAVERGIPFATVAITNAQGEWGATELAAPVLPDAAVQAIRTRPFLSRFPASIDPSPYPVTLRYAEPAPPESTREYVYATFGTEVPRSGHDPYRALLDAVDGLDVPVLLTTSEPLELRAPPNVTVKRWVAQHEALAGASMVVCHGGSGTVLGTLAAGLPLVILPLFADQFENARRLRGVARTVAPEELREAIRHPPPPPTALAAEIRANPAPLDALWKGIG